MPHKRNPLACIAILANARRTPGLVATLLASMSGDHERSTGEWHAEWETLSMIVRLTAGSLSQALQLSDGLEVNSDRMLRNLQLTGGLIYAESVAMQLTGSLGKQKANQLLEACCTISREQGIELKEVVRSSDEIMKYLSPELLDKLFDPANALGHSSAFTARVLESAVKSLD